MQTNGFNRLDIRKEIDEKRLSPEYVYDYLESNLRYVTKIYNDRTKAYRKNIKSSEKELSRTLDYLDDGIAAAAKSSKIIKEALKNFDSPKYFEILTMANNPLIEFTKIEFDASKWSKENVENFNNLHLEWLGIKHQAEYAKKALIVLIKGKSLKAIFKAIIFSLSFFISYYLGSYLEVRFAFTGEFWSKLITSCFFFIIVDWFLDRVKTKLIWYLIKVLGLDLEKLNAVNGNQQAIVNNSES